MAAYPDAAFVEIAPRSILSGPLGDIIKAKHSQSPILPTLAASDAADSDPVLGVVARIAANGISHDRQAVFGDAPASIEPLPPYPFQPEQYRFDGTSEAVSAHGRLIASEPLHPLLGPRVSDGAPEWRNLLDPVLLPYLSDHRVDGGAVMPAAGLIEFGLAAGREIFGNVPLEIGEFDITKALTFAEDETREISTRYFEHTHTVEIWSRRRFAGNDWMLHARGLLAPLREGSAERPRHSAAARSDLQRDARDLCGGAESRIGLRPIL